MAETNKNNNGQEAPAVSAAEKELQSAQQNARVAKDEQKAKEQARKAEKAVQEEKTAETDQAGADAIRQLVYDTADEANGGGVAPLSNEGAPLTAYEVAANEFFKEQNELEKQIDQIEVPRKNQALFAGTVTNALQSGDLNVGSATVTNYVGETIHPYPPTDFNAAAIVAGDLTTDPILATLGLIATNPMPPENNVHDIRETDGRIDTKDYSRRLRVPNDLIVEARRAKYPAGIEAPV